MNYLFIDTETSGLPQDWDLSYDDSDNWPYVFQISWLIYNDAGKLLTQSNLYISESIDHLDETKETVHRITKNDISTFGRSRYDVLQQLKFDLDTYRPFVVGHFIRFDYYVIGAEYARIGRDNAIASNRLFCTMKATAPLAHRSGMHYFRLVDLYKYLFYKDQLLPHDAFDDAKSTAECFFRLKNDGVIRVESIAEQNPLLEEKTHQQPHKKYVIYACAAFAFLAICFFLLWFLK